ncbi:MAG: multifunctional CCA tRNA nucleotidyl transferase/2'3'-cyclic phosphodiesterase/2'nucleotidase/phosphatase [Burkholderiales bacterium]|nr:multifunctional CCA tRNA nucleotidyl transferase/2'3'-cyclic phosphodiesterase/2'nucleotidase/phosphatase [Burkholderiales bacterium]
MKTYVVGGAVRDALLNLPVSDRDHVVVGATPEDMVRAGFRPVGADFPVFLHPETHEEYALARTERKTAPGYKGFVFHTSPDVTLEEDLRRRDLTINAMARDDATGALIDPYGGQRDLQAKVLRHVSEAFREDPVRILRIARFAARFAAQGFTVAPETLALMREMVAAGEVDALVPERVWQEVARGLMEQRPSRMFAVLDESGALERLLPEARGSAHAMATVDQAAACEYSQAVRYATLFLRAADERTADPKAASQRLKAPTECADLAHQITRAIATLRSANALDAPGLLTLFDNTDALRRTPRFMELLNVAHADHLVLHGKGAAWTTQEWLMQALYRLRSIDYGAIAAGTSAAPATNQSPGDSDWTPQAVPKGSPSRPGRIGDNIRKAKLAALEQFLEEN